jgi:hypothetical protein
MFPLQSLETRKKSNNFSTLQSLNRYGTCKNGRGYKEKKEKNINFIKFSTNIF